MKTKRKVMTEKEIDRIVTAQAEDKSAWEKPVRIRRSKSTSVSLPATLAAQAAFFARLHREASLENWLNLRFHVVPLRKNVTESQMLY